MLAKLASEKLKGWSKRRESKQT